MHFDLPQQVFLAGAGSSTPAASLSTQRTSCRVFPCTFSRDPGSLKFVEEILECLRSIDMAKCSRHDRAGEGTAGGGSVGRKDQQVVAPSRDKRFTAGHEGTFSKTLLFEK